MDACPNCTAPREAGAVICKFCQTPLVRDIANEAVKCRQCGTYSDIRATNCSKCQAWVVVKCIFCGAVSPHHFAACAHCREPFAGAMERWQARKEQAESAQRMQMISSVGGVAAAFLGAAAGVAISGSGSSYSSGYSGSHVAHRHRHHRHDDDSGSSWTDVFSSDDDSPPGGGGGGLMDSLSSDDSPPGGSGGGLMDSLLSGDDDNG